jgi:hypothetical protein
MVGPRINGIRSARGSEKSAGLLGVRVDRAVDGDECTRSHDLHGIAAPMAGGIVTSFVLELVVYPAIYEIWKWHFELKRKHAEPGVAPLGALPSTQGTP